MKKKTSPKNGKLPEASLRLEYDFSRGVRGKYARLLKQKGYAIRVYHQDGSFTEKRVLGEKTVTLAPDVQPYFPNSKAVNRALRTLIALFPGKRRAAPKKALDSERKQNPRRRFKT